MIKEKDIHRIQQELFNKQVHSREVDASDMPPEFKGFNKHKTYDLKRDQVATIYTAHGAPGPQPMIEEDGQEYQVMVEWGYYGVALAV